MILVLAVTLPGCDAGKPSSLGEILAPGEAKGFNILLVTIDTARRDRFGCYGYTGAQTATVDSLAAIGMRFDDAVASTPLTLPSHATLLTGTYPPVHGARDNGSFALGLELT